MDPFIFFNRKYLHINKFTPSVFLYNETKMYQHYSLYDIYHFMILDFENKVEQLYKLLQLLSKKKHLYSSIPIPEEEIEIIKHLNKKINKIKKTLDNKLLEIVKYFNCLKKGKQCNIFKTSVCTAKYDTLWKWDIKPQLLCDK